MLSTKNQNTAFNSQQCIKDVLGLIILFGIFYALWIGSHALFTPDEGRYSEVAREMVVSGDYITPRLNGVAFLDKPALYYWLQASAIHVFGLKEWALRFWPALMGIFGAVMVYFTGTLLFGRRTGIISAVILATSPLYYGAAHYANLDLEVAVLVSSSLLCFIAAIEGSSENLRRPLLLAAYVFAGLAALTKGLIGIVFPAMIIGAWVLLLNRWRLLLKMRLFVGAIIFLSITAPWYVLVQKANPEFLHFFFVTQQVSRFLAAQVFNSKAAFWFYVPVVLAGLFPWTIFLIQALAQKIKAVWYDHQHNAADLFLLLWFFIVLVFFSIPHSKLVGYILPLFPVGALIIGKYVSHFWDQPKAVRLAAIIFILLCGILAAVFFLAPLLNKIFLEIAEPLLPCLRAMAFTLLTAGTVMACIFRRNKTLWPVFTCLTVTVVVLLLTFISNAAALNEKTIKPLAIELKSKLKPDDEVATFYKYYQDLPLYLERRITIVADWDAADIAYKDNWLREMWYGMVFQNTKDWLIEEDTFWRRWRSHKQLYVITDQDHFKNLQAKTRVYKIAEHNQVVLFSNRPV